MGTYMKCPRSYYFSYIQGLEKRTDFDRLMGVAVHKFIADLYRPHKDKSRVFYYTSIEKARSAWFYSWKKALEENREKILFYDKEKEGLYGGAGWVCIQNYWNANFNKPKPVEIEKRITFPYDTKINFIGIFDQIREAPLKTIKRFRPELFTDGVLDSSIDPVFIVDLKTHRTDFDLTKFDAEASLMEQAAYQFELHEDMQVTAYYWLYYQWKKKIPAGFFWYHLRSNKWFYTYRTMKDFEVFKDQVRFVADGISALQFPKIVGSNCKKCDYFAECKANDENRDLIVSRPANLDDADFEHVKPEPPVETEKATQLRMKLKVPRVKVDKKMKKLGGKKKVLVIDVDLEDLNSQE